VAADSCDKIIHGSPLYIAIARTDPGTYIGAGELQRFKCLLLTVIFKNLSIRRKDLKIDFLIEKWLVSSVALTLELTRR